MSLRERMGLQTAGDWAALGLLILTGLVIGFIVYEASR